MMSSICKVNPAMQSSNISGTLIANSTSIQSSMRRLVNSFDKMYKKKAYVHWYTQEGMDLMEFEEARANINDLISEYQQYQEAEVNMGDDEEYDEEEMEFEKKTMMSSLGSVSTKSSKGVVEQSH